MSGTMRQQKYSRFLQKEISNIFQRDRRGILQNEMVTIAEVKISPDLGVAKVYISMMLAKDKDATLGRLNAHKSEIRKELGNKIGKQVRIIPELVFYIDEVEENAFKIDSLINSLNIPPASEGDKESQ
ncbi:MAG: 30S ribosome-binding factor RbfA [Cyclobacteriaceae bacterium]|nr:30S ribosome-binding factor RbfA [Cyclobacteriaceae bacterium]MCB0498701.1 30S ribosome-binding factor RbfA [Cyclobacteriaceae bacterium]MCB9237787.1 30S ribosome-binding factor RbfA [Flammeovirgaceae bacterium]MCW5903148.1 30S ribosome-binding factor RbfA [Cyclobacteriaceae bacterium]HPI79896.1 30S ribosome-binding factor RbfA [Cyclobacteriaceae bacterium]